MQTRSRFPLACAALLLPALLAVLLAVLPFVRPARGNRAGTLRFAPYGNESEVVGIGPDLTVENRLDRVTVAGSADFTLDREGAAKAAALRDLMARVCRELEAREPLPGRIAVEPPPTVPNPFRRDPNRKG